MTQNHQLTQTAPGSDRGHRLGFSLSPRPAFSYAQRECRQRPAAAAASVVDRAVTAPSTVASLSPRDRPAPPRPPRPPRRAPPLCRCRLAPSRSVSTARVVAARCGASLKLVASGFRDERWRCRQCVLWCGKVCMGPRGVPGVLDSTVVYCGRRRLAQVC